MAFDISRFYQDLDACYGNHDNAATEAFLKKSRDVADRAGAPMPVNTGCPSCVTPLEPNWAYVSVCNETACFYRGLSRFSESLEVFELAQKELESLYQQRTTEYATVLLNKAGTYRLMGELDQALKYFRKAADIFEQHPESPQTTLAGLYNNIGLVYLDQRKPQEALTCFAGAMNALQYLENAIVETGTTWNNIAAAYNLLDNTKEAWDAADHAAAILGALDDGCNPHYPAALNTRGTIKYRAGDYQSALEDFEEALEKIKLVYGENVEYARGCRNCAAVCLALDDETAAADWEQKADSIEKCNR